MMDFTPYKNLRICVATSGGRDSMALLHMLLKGANEYGITLSALNCNHKIRKETSDRDSEFVKEQCLKWGVPLICFVRESEGECSEAEARDWRLECYEKATEKKDGWNGADVIATAHHLNDAVETAILNIVRGTSPSGLRGITDRELKLKSGKKIKLIRPLKNCERKDIDDYISENEVPYVTDESNFTDAYARNRIRNKILPELVAVNESAVNGIGKFLRLAEEDEEFFEKYITERKLINKVPFGVGIERCGERAVFKRAAVKALKILNASVTDYTYTHMETLYILQYKNIGKRFDFLDFSAYNEEKGVVICFNKPEDNTRINFFEYIGKSVFCGVPLEISKRADKSKGKTLYFDLDKIPKNAVIRHMQSGDKFTKFGGGTKSLGDYFTDKKVPVRLRKKIPLVCDNSTVLIVCGVEISDGVKVSPDTENKYELVCENLLRN